MQQARELLQTAGCPSSEIDLSSTQFISSITTIGDLHKELAQAYNVKPTNTADSSQALFQEWCDVERQHFCMFVCLRVM